MKRNYSILESNPFLDSNFLNPIHNTLFRAQQRLGKELDIYQIEALIKVLKQKNLLNTSRNSSDLAKIYIREAKKQSAVKVGRSE
jgi:hypothetical protein